MKVRLTSRFHRDLHDIGEWIAGDDPDAAWRGTDELLNKALALGDLPRGFPVIKRRGGDEFRKRSHGNYIILYRLAAEVQVLRVVHVRRDRVPILEDL